jgi:hypothetical protein
MTYPPPARNYLIKALAGTPSVIERLLMDLGVNDPRWDVGPDPERFSLREAIAHLADWEPIWLGRVTRIRTEEKPFLPSIDEGELAIANDYAHQDPLANLNRYRAGRADLVKELQELNHEDWSKECDREFVGMLTMQMFASLILSHDGYHTAQVVEWLSKA